MSFWRGEWHLAAKEKLCRQFESKTCGNVSITTFYYRVWGVAVSVLVFVFARLLWNTAIRQYSSAGG